jgi:hypothetical protein
VNLTRALNILTPGFPQLFHLWLSIFMDLSRHWQPVALQTWKPKSCHSQGILIRKEWEGLAWFGGFRGGGVGGGLALGSYAVMLDQVERGWGREGSCDW